MSGRKRQEKYARKVKTNVLNVVLLRSISFLKYLEVLEYRRLLPLDLLGADALGEVAEQLVRVLLVHPAKLRRPLRYLR